MPSSARLFNCARCQRQVVICSHCDRGNRYCGKDCSQAARRASLRAAGQRYQQSRRGSFRHAHRQRRYCRRQTQKVTHQGSPAARGGERLRAESRTPARREPTPVLQAPEGIRCHRCARLCTHFVRQGFLRRRSPRPRSVTAPLPRAWASDP